MKLMEASQSLQVGKVDEIFGAIKDVHFSVKMMEGMVASSFKEDQKFYISPDKVCALLGPTHRRWCDSHWTPADYCAPRHSCCRWPDSCPSRRSQRALASRGVACAGVVEVRVAAGLVVC